MIQKYYKKKRTVANLLKTDHLLPDRAHEKRTYIKQYFEDQSQTSLKTLEYETCDDQLLSTVNDSSILSENKLLSPTNKKNIPTSTKVKDYVVAAEVLKPIKPVKENNPPPLTISKMTNSAKFSPNQLIGPSSEHIFALQKANNLYLNRLSFVRRRKSKIKDFINDENVSGNSDRNLFIEKKNISNKPSTEFIQK